MGGQHNISENELPYDPAKLERKKDIGIAEFFSVDIRVGVIVGVQDFPEMRKPSYKIEVDFGPIIGKLNTSAQITNYSKDELLLRTVIGTINLGKKKLPTGFISEFLIMGALEPSGKVRLLEAPSGTLPGSAVA